MALLLTKKTLNWYYGRTDESNVYRISMILHPGLKMAYFKKQNRPSDWLDNARHIIRSEYQNYVILRAAQSRVSRLAWQNGLRSLAEFELAVTGGRGVACGLAWLVSDRTACSHCRYVVHSSTSTSYQIFPSSPWCMQHLHPRRRRH
ncbi:hypothetical protein K438DRAFT_1842199 [Mycena galopus ATCC 62051]|nr:hypothetical protein K438DRAFT_1842199 [Mycena galopus ATCC 62051]